MSLAPDMAVLRQVWRQGAVLPLRVYQVMVSPLLPRACRFEPTCSVYALQAIARYGVAKGGWLAARRLARCQPRSTGGYDPVPATR